MTRAGDARWRHHTALGDAIGQTHIRLASRRMIWYRLFDMAVTEGRPTLHSRKNGRRGMARCVPSYAAKRCVRLADLTNISRPHLDDSAVTSLLARCLPLGARRTVPSPFALRRVLSALFACGWHVCT